MHPSATAPRFNLKDAGMVILSIICLMLALNIGLIVLDIQSIFLQSGHKSLITITLFLVQEGLFLLPLYWWVMRPYRVGLTVFGFRKISVGACIAWVLRGFGIVFITNMLLLLFMRGTRQNIPGFEAQEVSHIPLFGTSPFDITLSIIALIIIAPLIEEILFRGFLLRTFADRFSPWIANLLAAAIFALVHFEFQSVGIIFILALILNWIFLKSRSLWPCIAFHMINNTLAFVLEWMVLQGYFSV